MNLLAAIHDRLAENTQAMVAVLGGKPPRMEPLERPETAVDRVKRLRQKREFEELLDLVEASKKKPTAQ